VFGVSACVLLAGSIVFGGQQERELSGIHGDPDGTNSASGSGQTALTSGWDGPSKAKRSVASRRSCET
jgi:hypothetical protein